MKRPAWQIALLLLATVGLYSLYWWPATWKHIKKQQRGVRLIAFLLCVAAGFVPAFLLAAAGAPGVLAVLAVPVGGGVPVFRRPCGSFCSLSRAASEIAGWSPARPAE